MNKVVSLGEIYNDHVLESKPLKVDEKSAIDNYPSMYSLQSN
jgi:hypothetical protein